MRYLLIASRPPYELSSLIMRMSGIEPLGSDRGEARFYQYPSTIYVRRNLEEELRKDQVAGTLMRELGHTPQSLIEFEAQRSNVIGTMKQFSNAFKSHRIGHFYGVYDPPEFRKWDAYIPKSIK